MLIKYAPAMYSGSPALISAILPTVAPVHAKMKSPGRSVNVSLSASITFYCRGGGSDGKGEMVEDGFVVHEGSKARMEVAPSGASSVNPQREKLLTAGVLEETNGEYVFTQDYLFTSPSTAAAVVLGRTANGWVRMERQRRFDVERDPSRYE